MTLSPGEILKNRYRIVKSLAQGGFGTIYRAWDLTLNMACAVKENLDTSPDIQEQFSHEAAILAGLNHPNLPRVTDYFAIENKGQYLVMDFVEGDDLLEMLERTGGPLSFDQVLPWIGQVCDALEYLHSQTPPVIHRDIKPANIRITPQGQAKLVDFGIAKVYKPDKQTVAGARAVTPGFSPPEQYGQGTTDARSDIYALGATLYTLLTCSVPPDSLSILSKNADAPVLADQLNPTIPPGISQAIQRSMALSKADRFGNARDFKSILFQSAPVVSASSSVAMSAPSQPVIEQTSPPDVIYEPVPDSKPKKKKALWITAPLVFVLIVVICGVFGGQFAIRGYKNFMSTRTSQAEVGLVIATTLSNTETVSSDTPIPSPSSTSTSTSAPTIAPTETDTPVPALGIGSVQVSTIDEMVMVYVPEGEFEMGTSSSIVGSGLNERPVHNVTLDAFWIDQTEVTIGMYTLCVQAGVCTPPYKNSSASRAHYYDEGEFTDYPVIYVTWEDADTYCKWAERRLPTEAEWEKAARGSDGRLYPWGDELSCGMANYWGYDYYDTWDDWVAVQKGCQPDTVKVGSYKDGISPFQVYDLVGNVAEWVADWYSQNYYAEAPSENPHGPPSGTNRVVRGNMGYFLTYGVWVKYMGHNYNFSKLYFDPRPAYRYFADPSYTRYDLGFRCASTP